MVSSHPFHIDMGVSSKNCNSIIFSSWRKSLDVIAQGLTDFGLDYLRVDGAMQTKARKIALRDFQMKRNCKILIMTFGTGGAGQVRLAFGIGEYFPLTPCQVEWFNSREQSPYTRTTVESISRGASRWPCSSSRSGRESHDNPLLNERHD